MVGTAAAVVLAAIFVWAAVAKLRDPSGTASAFRAMQVRRPDALARAVPAAELGVAAALLISPTIGGGVAFTLLVGMTFLLAATVRAGRDVPCPCFGATRLRPIDRRDLVRNAALLGLALLAMLAS